MSELPEPLTPKAKRWYRRFRVPVIAIMRAGFRIEVVNGHLVPEEGGFILAPGAHRSIVDTPAAAAATDRTLRFLGAEKYFKIPVFGAWLRLVGGFPVERDVTDRQSLRVAEAVLAAGEPLVVFPESTRGEGAALQPLKEGAAFLATRANVPIVPVGIGGAERAFPKGARLPRPTKLVLVVGEPIQPPERPEGGRVPRSAIRGLSQQLESDLQALFDQAQSLAGLD